MYADSCGCDTLPNLIDDTTDWDAIYTEIANQLIQNKKANTTAVYNQTAKMLMQAIDKGFGVAYDDQESRKELQNKFKQNIAQFSYAKTLTQFSLFNDHVFNDKGQIQSFASVKKAIADTGAVFNNHYLRTEIQYVTQTAIMANKWETMQTEYLEYTTVGDSHVRPEHKIFDKFTALKTDPIWKRLYTPLSWNCRCTVIPGKANNVSKEYNSDWANKTVDPLVKNTIFDNNAAITGVVFNDKHPYFNNTKKEILEKDVINIQRKAKDIELRLWASQNLLNDRPLALLSKEFKTSEVRISKAVIDNLLKHISDVKNKELVKDIVSIIENAKYKNKQPLDKNKNPKNYGKKVARGVVYYNYYTSKWKDIDVVINMEVMKNGYEQPYAILLNKKQTP